MTQLNEEYVLQKSKFGSKTVMSFTKTWGAYAVKEVFEDKVYKDLEITPDDYVLDIWANVWAFVVDNFDKCVRIYAFEPAEDNYGVLKLNIRENGINNCVAWNKPVTRNWGEITFYEDTTPSSAINSIYKMDKCVEIKKESVSIIEVLNMEDFTKIKCDCEGAEFDIFKNLEVPLTVKQIIVEVHEPMIPTDLLADGLQVIEDLKRQFTTCDLIELYNGDGVKVEGVYMYNLKR